MGYRITTNNVPRDTLDSWELTPAERAEFDYLGWTALDDGSDSRTFVRYRGELIDLSDVPLAPDALRALGWDGFASDSYFSGVAVRYVEDAERVIVARVIVED